MSSQQPIFKPSFKLTALLNTIVLPYKERSCRFRHSMESSRFGSFHNISTRKNASLTIHAFPSISNRRASQIETIQRTDQLKQTQKHFEHYQQSAKISKSNQQSKNHLNDEKYIVEILNRNAQTTKNNNNKQQSSKKTRKQKLIEFLRGEHQTIQFTQLRKPLKEENLLPSFTVKKYQELQF